MLGSLSTEPEKSKTSILAYLLGMFKNLFQEAPQKVGVIDDELNKLYIDTQDLLEKCKSQLRSGYYPNFGTEIDSALESLGFIFENLTPESELSQVADCKNIYASWYSKLSHYESMNSLENVEEYLKKEAIHRKEAHEKYCEWVREEQATIKAQNKYIDELRRTYYTH